MSSFSTLLCIFLLLSEVFGIIERSDDRFRAKFTIIKPGRVSSVLMYRDDVAMRECLYACVSHLQCVSVNYHGDLKRCELSGSHFGDELHGRDLIGWKHFDTPQKVDGGYTRWHSISSCSLSCGGGVLMQHRYCTQPRPMNGGSDCRGRDNRAVACNTHACPSVWTLQSEAVCIKPTSPRYGDIPMVFHGPLTEMKLVHKSGKLTCDGDSSFNWGCSKGPRLAVVITNDQDEVIFPNTTMKTQVYYKLSPYNSNSDEIIFDSPRKDINVTVGDTLRVWFSRDLLKGGASKNTGEICMDVFAKTVRCYGQDNGCCTAATPCNKDEGDCDWDADCHGDLKCGRNNCAWQDNDDCCN